MDLSIPCANEIAFLPKRQENFLNFKKKKKREKFCRERGREEGETASESQRFVLLLEISA